MRGGSTWPFGLVHNVLFPGLACKSASVGEEKR